MFNQSGERTRMDEDLNREKHLCINEKAAKFYNSNLYTNENRGMSFLQQNGLSEDTITSFKLGYAPASGHALVNHLRNEGVSEDDILKVGLASINNGELCDKFCNRVMFPIINTQEKIIGFGGREIDNSNPKYLNMPENEVFLKRDNLFGLNLTWEEIKRVGEAIIVEGYMDMILLYQHGIKNAVATLGTDMSLKQAKLLCSYSKNVIFYMTQIRQVLAQFIEICRQLSLPEAKRAS